MSPWGPDYSGDDLTPDASQWSQDPEIILNFGELSIKQDSQLEALLYAYRNALQMDGWVDGLTGKEKLTE